MEILSVIELVALVLQFLFFISNIFIYVRNRKVWNIIRQNSVKLDMVLKVDIENKILETINRELNNINININGKHSTNNESQGA